MKKTSKPAKAVYKITRFLFEIFYPKYEIEGFENLPLQNAVIVANHSQMAGPINGELFMPENCYMWCAGQMMNMKETPEYAFNDFWAKKPKWTHPFYKLLSHMIAPLAYCLFNNARTIAVYKDARIVGTFRETLEMIKSKNNILIFPECPETCNNILYKFQENFVDIARLYYKRYETELEFVPMYIAPKLKKMYIGKKIRYDHDNDCEAERKRITEYLSDEITKTARNLPKHTVVPYLNIPKKRYLTNKDDTEVPS